MIPIREDAALAPINTYGETKRTFEGALRWYARRYGLRSVSLRYFNVAGRLRRATARSTSPRRTSSRTSSRAVEGGDG